MKRLVRQFLLCAPRVFSSVFPQFFWPSPFGRTAFWRSFFAGLLVVASFLLPNFFLPSFYMPSFFMGIAQVQAAESGDIGAVIAYTPGASLLRGGVTESLALNAGIKVSDSITTDAAGRVKILLNDDSFVSLGPNTTLDMSEYADAGSSSAFGINLGSGLARIITGKIVEQNPDGFKVSCPQAIIGIRGTIITIHVTKGPDGNDVTTVYVENTLRQVFVNDINVPGGHKIVLPDGTISPITPDDRRFIGQELAFLGGSGSAAASPEASGVDDGLPKTSLYVAGLKISWDGGDLDDKLPLLSQPLGNNISITPLMGQVTGIHWGDGSGTYGFDVDLTSGVISNGYVIHDQYALWLLGDYSSSLSGGTGLANAAGFNMNVSGMGTFTPTSGAPIPLSVDAWLYDMGSPSTNLTSLPTGSAVSAGIRLEYDLGGTYNNVAANVAPGTFTK